jgi:hypothetical protein
VTEHGLTSALREARIAEAAHFEAVLGIRDAKSLRLHALREDLKASLVQNPEAGLLFDLALVPGEAPRLWIDLISFVQMEPDYRTYQFCLDGETERKVQFETSNLDHMKAHLTKYLAHKVIGQEKAKADLGANSGEVASHAVAIAPEVSVNQKSDQKSRFSLGAVVYAWLSGFVLGGLVLAIVFILLKKLAI